ncbi:MAG: hypothetical protein IPH89_16185 [Bacteroidetes bacterium]|nr:hypothetical protein [Bacteroidota bacterium]
MMPVNRVIQEFKYENKNTRRKELYAFYVRMLASHPKEEYYYNTGSLMYNYAESHADIHQRIAYSVPVRMEPVAEDLPFGIVGQPVDLMTLQTEINGAIEYDLMINPAKH